MASIRREILTRASVDDVWSAIRDIGALHTRLVPGFVVDTKLVPGARIVTFGSGMVIEEPIIDIDDTARRLVWGAIGGALTHYNGSVQVFAEDDGARVIWVADLLPNDAAEPVRAMIDDAMTVMKQTLDELAECC